MNKNFKKLTAIILAAMLVASTGTMTLSVSAAAETPIANVGVSEDVYVVAGMVGLTGYTWDGNAETAPNAVMVANADGTYSVTFKDVAAAKALQYKIVKNGGEWIGDATGNNFTFDVTDVCDVTVTYNPTTGEATATGEFVATSVFELDALYAVGNGDETWLNEASWDPAAEVNKMTEVKPGVYEIEFTGVEAYDNYQIKFAANGSWADSWGIADTDGDGTGDAYAIGSTIDATYNGQNIVVDLGDDDKTYTVKCVVDLSTYDATTKTGGNITITAVDESLPVVDDVYVVAGMEGLTGYTWDGNAETAVNAVMTANADGTYSVTFKDVAPAKALQYKVVKNATEWIGDATGNNFTFDVTETCDITITYNPATGEAKVEGAGVVESTFELESLYAVGNGDGTWLNDAAWDPAADINKMTEVKPGVYEIEFKGVEAYDNYQIKFAANGSWADSWGIADTDADGTGDAYTLGSTIDATYNGQNIVVDLGDDDKTYTVKCTVDLNGFDYATKTGGTIVISATEEKAAPVYTIVTEDESFSLKMSKTSAKYVSGKIALQAGTYKIKVEDDGKLYANGSTVNNGSSASYTMKTTYKAYLTLNATGGTYTFRWDIEGKKLLISYDSNLPANYLVGDLHTILAPVPGNETMAVGSAYLEKGTYKFKLSSNGVLNGYSKVVQDNTAGGSLSFNSKYGAYVTLNVTGGTYTFSLNTKTNKMIVKSAISGNEANDDVHISGNDELSGLVLAATEVEDVYTATTHLAEGTYSMKVYFYGEALTNGVKIIVPGKNNYKVLSSSYTASVTLIVGADGDYQFTFDKTTNKLTVDKL